MITPERWQQIDEVFQEAVELPSGQRGAFLDRVCGADPELRREVECLLESDEQAQGKLLSAVQDAAGWLADDVEREAPSLIGQRIGHYEIVREIGRGGMGTVYQAVRADEQYLQSVAIKFVSQGVETRRTLSRIRIERQILATLQHANIAALLDGGTTLDGRPYIVMEYIDGEPLLDYCSRRSLSVPARVELFRALCNAVQYAHQMLVIHRDIKPGNVMVTSDGVPKLLDFGIAKLLTPELVPGVEEATKTLHRVLTPDYASPEQIRGEPLTTATDIYSLGVLLYELLTSAKPYRGAGRSPEEVMRMVCDSEPLRLTAPVAAEPRLRRQLAGDLENIVAMALRKEPQRRYSSVQQFSEDLHRYLTGLPIAARPDTIFYRAGKLVRRNRLATAAFTLVVVSVAAGWVSTIREARRTERRFQEVRKLANAVLFDFHAKIQYLPGSIPAREMLVRTALEYLNNLSQDAQNDVSLQWELSQAYERVGDVQGDPSGANLGQFREALSSYRNALELVRRVARKRPDHETLSCLVWLHYKIGDLESRSAGAAVAMTSYRQGVAAAAELNDPGNDDLLRNGYQRLSSARLRSGDVDGAIESARMAAAAAQRYSAKRPGAASASHLARTSMLLGNVLWLRGDLMAARDNLQSAVTHLEQLAASRPGNASYLADLQEAYRRAGDLQGNPSLFHFGNAKLAAGYQEKALTIARTLVARDPKDAKAKSDLTVALRRLGSVTRADRPAHAVELYGEAIAILNGLLKEAPGDSNYGRDRANAQLGLGVSLTIAGRAAAAIEQLGFTLNAQRSLLEKNPERLAIREDMFDTYVALGDARRAARQWDAAHSDYQEALSIARWLLKAGSSRLYAERCFALVNEQLGEFYAPRQRDRAEASYNEALRVWSRWSSEKLALPYSAHREQEVRAAMQRRRIPVHPAD